MSDPTAFAPPPGRGASRWVVVTLTVVVAVMALLGALVWFSFDRFTSLLPFAEQRTVDRTQGAVLLALEDLSTYTAASGRFQVIVDIERDVSAVPSAIAGERTLFVAMGSVDATVDFSGLGAEAIEVDPERGRVTIRLPAAQLSDATVDPEASYVFERERGLLDRLGSIFSDNPTSERELYVAAERELEEVAQDTRLRDRAEDNTRAMLQGLLHGLGFDVVTVRFG